MSQSDLGRVDFRPDGSDRSGNAHPPHFPSAPAGRAGTDPFVLGRPTPPPLPPARPRRGPAVLTGVALAAALAVVGAASWVTTRPEPVPVADPVTRRVNAVRPATTAAPRAPWTELESAEGTGTITLPQHRWVGGTDGAPRLLVQVTLADRSGQLHYDPDLISVLDERGSIYPSLPPSGRLSADVLGSGVLSPGQSTTGWLAFDVPRGPVTVTLRSWHDEDVAALRLPG